MSHNGHDLPQILSAAAAADPHAQNTQLYLAWHQHDDLAEKLKLLDYEAELLRPMNQKPLPRHYFALARNVGEQFFLFQSLCAWLVRRIGRDFEQPQEFHDPSQTIAQLQRHLTELGISTDFPTSALMSGAGLVCVHVLDALATQAVGVQLGGRLGRPQVKEAVAEDAEGEEWAQEEENEIILERLDEEQMLAMQRSDGEDDDDDDEDGGGGMRFARGSGGVLDLRGARNGNVSKAEANGTQNATATTIPMDSESWRLELERVLPQLKVVVKADARDWRAHWEQMRQLKGSINGLSSDTLAQLTHLRTDITHAFEKIASRESHLNTNLASLIVQHKSAAIEYAELRAAQTQIDAEKATLEERSGRMDDEFTGVRQQMEQRGSAMSDGTPLIQIKKAVQRVREEIVEMELEIAVLRHSVDQDVMKENAMYAELANEARQGAYGMPMEEEEVGIGAGGGAK